MTSAQRKHLEQRLLDERRRVVSALDRYRETTRDSVREESGDLSSVRFHLADEGTDTFDQELEASNAARQSRELAEIDAALERLYQHPERYGVCERTGREIPFERLDIIPWARTCDDRK